MPTKKKAAPKRITRPKPKTVDEALAAPATPPTPATPGDPQEPDEDLIRVQGIMAEEGCSFHEALAFLADEKGILAKDEPDEPVRVAGPPRLHPDMMQPAEGDADLHETVVRALKRMGYLVVHLKERHREWLAIMAQYEGALRRRPEYSAEAFAELVIREAYAADPTKGGTILAAASGRQIDFDPKKASWNDG